MWPNDPRAPASAAELLQLTRLEPLSRPLSGSLYLPVFEALVELRRLGIAAEWSAIFDAGWRCLGLAHAALQRHQDRAVTLRRADMRQQMRDAFTDAAIEASFSDDDLAALRAALSAEGEAVDATAGVDAAMAAIESDPDLAHLSDEFDGLRAELTQMHESALADTRALLDAAAGPALLDALRPRHDQIAAALAGDDAMLLAGLSRGLIAVAHAGFNLTAHDAPSVSAFVSGDHLLAVDRWIGDFEMRLRGLQFDLHVACARQSFDEVAAAGQAMATGIERDLPRFVRAQAVLRHAMAELRQRGRNSDAELLGRRAAQAGGLTREALGSHVAAARIVQEAVSGFRSDTVTELMDNAARTAFDGELPNGRNAALKDLPARPDGEFVEIEGFVDAVSVFTPPGRSRVSRVDLLDPSNGATFPAVLLFAHLPHAGLTQGAFCCLHGIVRAQSDLNEGQPAVEIDRLSLAPLAEDQWRIAFLRSARPWYEVWRSNAHMVWSLGPHRALDAQDEVALGAADLVYPPFVRQGGGA